jgi:hypothetical protein
VLPGAATRAHPVLFRFERNAASRAAASIMVAMQNHPIDGLIGDSEVIIVLVCLTLQTFLEQRALFGEVLDFRIIT